MKWRVILEPDPETGDWAVWCTELPGCTSAGETEDEALRNIQDAIALFASPALRAIFFWEGAIIGVKGDRLWGRGNAFFWGGAIVLLNGAIAFWV